ncbi:hypothetical protein MMC25_006606 [Agyrium rufum]|nr:hypothetical protein [Agyrium rufum]
MRASIARLAFALALLTPVISAAPPGPRPANVEEDVLGIPKKGASTAKEATGATVDSTTSQQSSTTFNGISVPPMKEIKGDEFDAETKDGYWFVKHYSPYCHHCHAVAPVWQTLYEYYYTSSPVKSESSSDSTSHPNSFQPYYNFHFGSLDCVTWGDTCGTHDVSAFPTFILYKDGEQIKKFEGRNTMQRLSDFVEEALDSIRPDSRPKSGIQLPEVGATSVEVGATPATPENKDEHAAAAANAGKELNQQKERAANVVTPVATVSATAAAKAIIMKPKQIPNPLGASVVLTQESFQKLVTTTQDPWFIKFYAPWCHHCQALAPNWQQMAREMEGKLNVGDVNCDVEVRLCKDVRIRGFPTMHYFRGGERVEYTGLRGLGDLVSYAKKALTVGSGVRYVDAAAFKELEENEEVIFIYFYDGATTKEDFEALERLTLSLIGHAILVKTDSATLADKFTIHTWPRLVVSRDGRPSYYNALAPKDMRDFRQVLSWMQSVWLPIVPELTASNSREIMNGKFVVLGILSREPPDEFLRSKREIKSAALEWMDKETHAFQQERQEMRDAKQLRMEEADDRNDKKAKGAAQKIKIEISETDRKQVGFAWVDGVFWERWIKTTYGIDVNEGYKIIINDEDTKRYWDTTASGASILASRTMILETLPKVVIEPPKIAAKHTTGRVQQAIFHTRTASSNHPWVTAALVIAVLGTVAMYLRGRMRKGRVGSSGGFFQLDGREKGFGGSGSANGKKD